LSSRHGVIFSNSGANTSCSGTRSTGASTSHVRLWRWDDYYVRQRAYMYMAAFARSGPHFIPVIWESPSAHSLFPHPDAWVLCSSVLFSSTNGEFIIHTLQQNLNRQNRVKKRYIGLLYQRLTWIGSIHGLGGIGRDDCDTVLVSNHCGTVDAVCYKL